MAQFFKHRRKNFWIFRKIIKIKRSREANFPHILFNKMKKERVFVNSKSNRKIYNQSPKPPRKDNQTYYNTNDGNSRHNNWYYSNNRRFCVECNHSQNNMKTQCTQCGSEKIITLWYDVRVPKKNASKKLGIILENCLSNHD